MLRGLPQMRLGRFGRLIALLDYHLLLGKHFVSLVTAL